MRRSVLRRLHLCRETLSGLENRILVHAVGGSYPNDCVTASPPSCPNDCATHTCTLFPPSCPNDCA